MTIDEIIKRENEIVAEFQRTVDTHIVDDNGFTIEEMCCDDTEVINEHLSLCKGVIDYHKQIVDTMDKYQKIERIVDRPTGNNAEEKAYSYMMIVKDIKEVLKDENNT